MASTSSPHSHLPSDSDSDSGIEPNAPGSRLFWGNLKTPEKSHHAFIDPPQTVIRPHTASPIRYSPQSSKDLSLPDTEMVGVSDLYEMAETDIASHITDTNVPDNLKGKSTEVVYYDVLHQEVNSDALPGISATAVGTSDIENKQLPMSQPSHSKDLEAAGTPIKFTGALIEEEQKSMATNMPDLVTLDNPLPLNVSSHVIGARPSTPIIQDGSPFLTSITSTPRSHEDLPSTLPSTPKARNLPLNEKDRLGSHPLLDSPITSPGSGSHPLLGSSITSPGFGSHPVLDSSITSPSRLSSNDSEQHVVTLAEASAGLQMAANASHEASFCPSTPKKASSGLASLAETRKRSPNKVKDTADSVNFSGNVLVSSAGSPLKGDDSDQILKKERRIKVKQEMERTRQQLLSLSPASSTLLNLLASPIRENPTRLSPQRGPGHSILGILSGSDQVGKARRVLVPASSPERPSGSELRLRPPAPVSLDDPQRTPARRIPTHTITSYPHAPNDSELPHIRKVPVLLSPTKHAKLPEVFTPRTQVVARPPFGTQLSSPTQATAVAAGSQTILPSPSVSSAVPTPTQLPPDSLTLDESGPDIDATSSSVQPNTSMVSQPSASTLRHTSSISVNKSSLLHKPYSRFGLPPSRLPVPSSLRRITPSGSVEVKPAISIRQQTSTPNLPSRIPSPIKRQTPGNNPSLTLPSPLPATVEITQPVKSHKRKRQGTESSDSESDAPPSKRPIVTQPGVKSMHEVGHPVEGYTLKSSPYRQSASPLRRPQSLSLVQIRPGIPRALHHFETTGSSSRNFVQDQVESHDVQPQPTSKDPPDALDSDKVASVVGSAPQPQLHAGKASSSCFHEGLNLPEPRRTGRIRKTRITAPRIATTSRTFSSKSSTRYPGPLESFPTNPRLLQSLTDANTLRNQVHVAQFERTVIRKSGPRPPSPTTKVKTILEKSKEERSRERQIRAERRRRRDQGSTTTDDAADLYDMDVSSSPVPPDLIAAENNPANKHPRAPGDEVDYETPERPSKASKLDPTKPAKTVKWDHSLTRDKMEISSVEQQENATRRADRKSCLARSLPLDPLGNILEADTPLKDLEIPHVIVTRFVYDDDSEELPPRAAKEKKA